MKVYTWLYCTTLVCHDYIIGRNAFFNKVSQSCKYVLNVCMSSWYCNRPTYLGLDVSYWSSTITFNFVILYSV